MRVLLQQLKCRQSWDFLACDLFNFFSKVHQWGFMLWLAKASSCLSLLASLTMNIRTICGIGVLWRLICLKRPWRSPEIITESQKILTHRVDNSALPLWAVTHGLVLAWEGMYPLPSPHGWTSDDGGLSAVWQQSQNYSKPKMQPGKGSKCPCLEKSGRMFLEYIEKNLFLIQAWTSLPRERGALDAAFWTLVSSLLTSS